MFAGGTKDVLPDSAVVIITVRNKRKLDDDHHQILSTTGPFVDHYSSHISLELARCRCLQSADADLYDDAVCLGVEGNTALLDFGPG